MADTPVIIPTTGNERPRINLAGMPRISTATLPDLVQTYCMAEDVLPYFSANPDRLKNALDDPSRRNRTIATLQYGAKALSCLECLADGSPEALEYLETLLTGLTRDLFTAAEKA